MRGLIDTNIIIEREIEKEVRSELSSLLKIIYANNIGLLVHPLSIEEIKRDKDLKRRSIELSKIKSYPVFDSPPSITNPSFLTKVPIIPDINEMADNALLYALYINAVDFLITEDKKIHRKAKRVGIADRVFSVDEALKYFEKILIQKEPRVPIALRKEPIHNLSINDPIFDRLKKDYDFVNWWKKISSEGRSAWIYRKPDDLIGAILILKIENEIIPSHPIIPKKKRLKICTLKVAFTGQKIGELLLKTSFDFAVENELNEIYLTHFPKQNDLLLNLIEDYGFKKVGELNGEDIFLKELIPPINISDPTVVHKDYYPSFVDNNTVRKHIVPIIPEFYDRLFEGGINKQLTIDEIHELITERNTIKKAYLCNTFNRDIRPGDVLLIYRSHDIKSIVGIGTVESIFYDQQNPLAILKIVGKRTVYSLRDIEKMVDKPVVVILFRHHFFFPKNISYAELRKAGILTGPPRTITTIDHRKYGIVISIGGIDERFTVH